MYKANNFDKIEIYVRFLIIDNKSKTMGGGPSKNETQDKD